MLAAIAMQKGAPEREQILEHIARNNRLPIGSPVD